MYFTFFIVVLFCFKNDEKQQWLTHTRTHTLRRIVDNFKEFFRTLRTAVRTKQSRHRTVYDDDANDPDISETIFVSHSFSWRLTHIYIYTHVRPHTATFTQSSPVALISTTTTTTTKELSNIKKWEKRECI